MDFLRVSLIAAILGGFAAAGGLAVEKWNVDHHGAEYSSCQFYWLTLGALPGMMITEACFGWDLQLGEIMLHRNAVIGWNALTYAVLGASASALFRVIALHLTTPNSAQSELPKKAEHRM